MKSEEQAARGQPNPFTLFAECQQGAKKRNLRKQNIFSLSAFQLHNFAFPSERIIFCVCGRILLRFQGGEGGFFDA